MDDAPDQSFLQTPYGGYNVLPLVFEYLDLPDLLKARSVCSLWKDVADDPHFWRKIQIDKDRFSPALAKQMSEKGTRHLDLRTSKYCLPNEAEWYKLSDLISLISTLKRIDLCYCPANFLLQLAAGNPELEVINAFDMKYDHVNLEGLRLLKNIRELNICSQTRLRQITGLTVLKDMKKLRKLSLTAIYDLYRTDYHVIGELPNLTSLDLGSCDNLPKKFYSEILIKLISLQKLTLIYGGINHVLTEFRCMHYKPLQSLTNLRELCIKANGGIIELSNIEFLKGMKQLRSLSLTTIFNLRDLDTSAIGELTNLETLELGSSSRLPKYFGVNILAKLQKLKKLIITFDSDDCEVNEILVNVKGMKSLEHLELLYFNTDPGFDIALAACTNIRKLMIIPSNILGNAKTVKIVLDGVLRLRKNLTKLSWGFRFDVTNPARRVGRCTKNVCVDNNCLKLNRDIFSSFGCHPTRLEFIPFHIFKNTLSNKLPFTKVQCFKANHYNNHYWRLNEV